MTKSSILTACLAAKMQLSQQLRSLPCEGFFLHFKTKSLPLSGQAKFRLLETKANAKRNLMPDYRLTGPGATGKSSRVVPLALRPSCKVPWSNNLLPKRSAWMAIKRSERHTLETQYFFFHLKVAICESLYIFTKSPRPVSSLW